MLSRHLHAVLSPPPHTENKKYPLSQAPTSTASWWWWRAAWCWRWWCSTTTTGRQRPTWCPCGWVMSLSCFNIMLVHDAHVAGWVKYRKYLPSKCWSIWKTHMGWKSARVGGSPTKNIFSHFCQLSWVETGDSLFSGEVSFPAMDALDAAYESSWQENHKEKDQYDQQGGQWKEWMTTCQGVSSVLLFIRYEFTRWTN